MWYGDTHRVDLQRRIECRKVSIDELPRPCEACRVLRLTSERPRELGPTDSHMFDMLHESALGGNDSLLVLLESVKDRSIRVCARHPVLCIFRILKDDIVVEVWSSYLVNLGRDAHASTEYMMVTTEV